MNIAVYFSVLCDTEEVLRSTWEKLSVEHIDMGYANRIVNPYDETAIEYALRIKDGAAACGEKVNITLFTIGEDLPRTVSENLFAVGVDSIYCINEKERVLLHTGEQLEQLEAYLNTIAFDFLFMGQQNTYSCDSSIGARLASRLNLPYVGYVSHIEYDQGALRVKCHAKSGFLCADVVKSSVFSFENTEHPYLRIATLRERLKTKSWVVEQQSPVKIEGVCEYERLEMLEYKPSVRKCVKIEGNSLSEQARRLLAIFRESVMDA